MEEKPELFPGEHENELKVQESLEAGRIQRRKEWKRKIHALKEVACDPTTLVVVILIGIATYYFLH